MSQTRRLRRPDRQHRASQRAHAASWSTASKSSDRINPKGISKTPSRALIFVCDPKTAGEPACAKQITENLARRAFRRPVTRGRCDPPDAVL